MKKKFFSAIFLILFIVGLGAVMYPSISNWVNERNSSKVVSNYNSKVSEITKEDYSSNLDAAIKHNEQLAQKGSLSSAIQFEKEDFLETYNALLNIAGEGVMAVLRIPKIQLTLPIYHTTEDEIIQVAVGHYVGSSLPCGGDSTHCILSGHRGLPSAKLFTDLDMLGEGDMFYIDVLGDTHAYQIDSIQVVEPHELDSLDVIPGEDYVTLVTCTPYGVNTHRMLVRGTRVPYIPEVEKEIKPVEPVERTTEEDTQAARLQNILKFAMLAFGFAIAAGVICGNISKNRTKKRRDKQ